MTMNISLLYASLKTTEIKREFSSCPAGPGSGFGGEGLFEFFHLVAFLLMFGKGKGRGKGGECTIVNMKTSFERGERRTKEKKHYQAHLSALSAPPTWVV